MCTDFSFSSYKLILIHFKVPRLQSLCRPCPPATKPPTLLRWMTEVAFVAESNQEYPPPPLEDEESEEENEEDQDWNLSREP